MRMLWVALLACTSVVGCGSAEEDEAVNDVAQPLVGALQATFEKQSSWDAGYVGEYTIVNGRSTATTSWKLEFDMPAGTTITSSWDTLLTRSGNRYTLRNLSFNGTIAPGSSVSLGFLASGLGNPRNCLINGEPCVLPPLPACTAAPWSATAVYPPGAKAVSQGRQYTAVFWNQNLAPALNSGPSGSGRAWITGEPCQPN